MCSFRETPRREWLTRSAKHPPSQKGNDASPLPLVVGAAETAGRTLPVGWEASVCGFGVIGMSLLAVGVGVITGIGAGSLL
jgi:hypothetical protein